MWFTLIPAFLRAVLVVNVRMHHDGSRIARRPARLLRTQVLARISHSRALTDTWRCTWAARVAYRAPGRMQVVFGGTERAVSA